MSKNACKKLKKTWLKLLKAEVKHKRKKIEKLEKKMLSLEIELRDEKC